MISSVINYFTPLSILDIGANTGQFYLESKKTYNKSYYFLVEPNPSCERVLSTYEVDYYIGAFSDTIKPVKFLMSKLDEYCTGNSLYRESTNYYSDNNLIELDITTETLDSYFAHKTIKRFDLIKMDTQGSELDILKGGRAIVKQALGLILEVAVADYNKGAPKSEEVFNYVESIGFTKVSKVGVNYNPETRELVHEDYLFINNSIL